MLITSTPNGTVGEGEWFYDMYQYAVDSDLLFDEKNIVIEEAAGIIDNPERNGFARVKFHWSADPEKDDKWYAEQCRDLNFNRRLINQELDLLFVGSTTCIFDDDYLAKLKSVPPTYRIQLPHATTFYVYSEAFNANDYLLIGVDTAKSLVGDYSAIEVFSYSNFTQIGEFFGKLGSLTKYSEVLKELIKQLSVIMNGKLILCIENNSIGSAIIENLENDTDFDYIQYVYSPIHMNRSNKAGQIVITPKIGAELGINTNVKSKSIMVSALYDYLTADPTSIKSSDFIAQLNVIERKANGSISCQYGKHDDLFMAAALCAYVRRVSTLEYEPLIGTNLYNYQEQISTTRDVKLEFITSKDMQSIADTINYNEREGGYEYKQPQIEYDDEIVEDVFSIF